MKIVGLLEDTGREGNYVLEVVDDIERNEEGKLIRYCGYQMEFLSQDFIDERNSIDWADNERDLWEEEVRCGYTDSGLEEWWEDKVINTDGLFPYDDYSYRSEVEGAWDNLTAEQREKLEEFVGKKGEDFATFNCVGIGHFIGDPSNAKYRVVTLNKKLLEEILEVDKPLYAPKYCASCGKQFERNESGYYSNSPVRGEPICADCDRKIEAEKREQNRKAEIEKQAKIIEDIQNDLIYYFKSYTGEVVGLEIAVKNFTDKLSVDTLKEITESLKEKV